MTRDEDKLIRQLSLLSFLLSRSRPATAREIQEAVEGYWGMSDDTFTRRFHNDRTSLANIGIEIRSTQSEMGDSTGFYLPADEYRLPPVEFTEDERRALAMALSALEGRFAYARPLRLALAAIFQGVPQPGGEQLEQLPVALAPDEDARKAGSQLARLQDAVARHKTVCFSYRSAQGKEEKRRVDPYSLFFIQGRWYVVGFDHLRQGIRTFRVTRITGPVRFLTSKAQDFTVPANYDAAAYRARPPWLLGKVTGTATVKVEKELAWWVSRWEPHVRLLQQDPAGCSYFELPFADEDVLLSWIVGLSGCGELVAPLELRAKLADALAGVVQAHTGVPPGSDGPPKLALSAQTGSLASPIAPENLARALSLMQYLVDENTPTQIAWATLEHDLGLSRAEIEHDLSLLNLVNFGGGTFALSAFPDEQGVTVTREVMADVFAKPARLSPLLARALLLALDLIGAAVSLESVESLASVRDKVRKLAAALPAETEVMVDDVVHLAPGLLPTLSRAIHEQQVVMLEYFTPTRGELSKRRVEPYLLFRTPEGWYLEAYCLTAQAQRTFRLEFIRTAQVTPETFTRRPEVDLSPRLSDQPLRPVGTVSWATVRFAPRWRAYLEDRGLAYEVLSSGELRAALAYLDERWLTQEIIRFLGDATVESPLPARENVRRKALSLLETYNSNVCTAEGGEARP